MAPIGLKAVVGESKIIIFLISLNAVRCSSAARIYGCICLRARVCVRVSVCFFSTGCGCQLVQLGDEDEDDDEGGAVGVPLCRVVRQSRAVREL